MKFWMYLLRWGVISVTLFKLSLRNAKRQTCDYLIYFATVVMAAAMLYAFNGLAFSGELAELLSHASELTGIVIAASMVIVGIFGWLVAYATSFMLNRRSRELGLYILSGMTNKQVARLFYLENLVIGAGSFVIGILLGNILNQLLRAVVLTIFELPYTFSFAFSLPAIGLTLVYFSLIFLLALDRTHRHISKMKIYDLFYFERQNQGSVISSRPGRLGVFVLSVISGIVGMVLLMYASELPTPKDLAVMIAGGVCMIIFLYGFFLSFASSVPVFFEKHPVTKYKKQNLLVFRTLTARLGTMGATMATISLLFTATLVSLGTGLVLYGEFCIQAEERACFDIHLSADAVNLSIREYNENLYKYKEVTKEAADFMAQEVSVEESLYYEIYAGKNRQLQDYIEKTMGYDFFSDYEHDQPDMLMRYSDYAMLRSFAGYPKVSLPEGKYLIHCIPYLYPHLENYTRPITAGGQTLECGGVFREPFMQRSGFSGNGNGLILVVPDEAVEGGSVHHLSYAAKTKQPVGKELYTQFCRTIYDLPKNEGMENFSFWLHAKGEALESTAYHISIIVFPLCFLALALAMTAATILTIQQLAETKHYRQQFGLLNKLGMDRREMAKALRMQSFFYYGMPLVPPVIVFIPLILHQFKAWFISEEMMTTVFNPVGIIAISLGLFSCIYAVYIVIAYSGVKRNVLPKA